MARIARVPQGGGYNIKTGAVTDKSGNVVSTRAEREQSWSAKDRKKYSRSGSSSSSRRRREASQRAAEKKAAEAAARDKAERERANREKQQEKRETVFQIKEQRQGLNENFQTRQNVGTPNTYQPPVYTQPTVVKRQVDTYRHKGNDIPITETIYIDPTRTGEDGAAYQRPATEEEKKKLDENREYVVSDKPMSNLDITKDKISFAFSNLNENFREAFTDRPAEYIVEKTKGTSFGGETGLTLDKAKQNIKESTEFLIDKGVNPQLARTGEFISGVGVGAVQDVREQPLKQAIIYGVSAGAGSIATGISTGGQALRTSGVILKETGKVVRGTAATVTGTTLTALPNVAGIAGGAYFASQTLPKIDQQLAQGNFLEAGSLTGVTLKDLGIAGAGIRTGQKITTKGIDALRTRGRTDLPIEDIGFKSINEVLSGQKRFVESSQFGYKGPSSGFAKQQFDLKTFQQAGRGYHVSPGPVSGGKGFTAGKGSSEFAGLYVAPSPSIYFGKGGESKFGFGLFKISNPTIARIYGKGFTTKGLNTQGKAFIPGIKPEIEGVYGAGTKFLKIGTETATKFPKEFGGRNVPIDTFQAVPSGTQGAITGGQITATYSSSVGSSAFINPLTTLTLSSGSSSSSGNQIISSVSVPNEIKIVSSTSDVSSYSSTGSGVPSITTSGGSSRGRSSRGSGSSSLPSSPLPSSLPRSPSRPSSGRSYKSYISSRGSSYSSILSGSSSSSSSRGSTSQSYTGFALPKLKGGGKKSEKFGVQVRRGGKFYNVGSGLTLNQALNLGRSRTGTTLARSFRVTGLSSGVKLPKGYNISKTLGRDVVVESSKLALNTGSETSEIRGYKRAKKKKKSSQRGSKRAVSRRKRKKK